MLWEHEWPKKRPEFNCITIFFCFFANTPQNDYAIIDIIESPKSSRSAHFSSTPYICDTPPSICFWHFLDSPFAMFHFDNFPPYSWASFFHWMAMNENLLSLEQFKLEYTWITQHMCSHVREKWFYHFILLSFHVFSTYLKWLCKNIKHNLVKHRMEDVWSLLRKHTHTMARMKMPEDENCCEMSCTFRDLSSREDFSSLCLLLRNSMMRFV